METFVKTILFNNCLLFLGSLFIFLRYLPTAYLLPTYHLHLPSPSIMKFFSVIVLFGLYIQNENWKWIEIFIQCFDISINNHIINRTASWALWSANWSHPVWPCLCARLLSRGRPRSDRRHLCRCHEKKIWMERKYFGSTFWAW